MLPRITEPYKILNLAECPPGGHERIKLMETKEIVNKDIATREVYVAIMKWLESGFGPLPGTNRMTLRLEVPGWGAPETVVLLFRRVSMLSQGDVAESVKDPRIRIAYDPNWNAMDKIKALLEPEEVQG